MSETKPYLYRSFRLGILLVALIHSNTANADLSLLEHQIAGAEAQVENLIDGTQKEIEWFNDERQKTAYSIVYIHGFSATRKEISPVPEALAKKLGANIFFTRLSGHGRDGKAMLDGSIEAWLEDTKQAFEIGQQIGDKVIVMGTSTGATLTTWLCAQKFASDLHANIMVSPNFALANSKAWLMQSSLGMWLVKKLQGDYHSFEPMNDYHAKYWTERYPIDALVPMLDLVDMVNEIDKSTIQIPQLMIYSPQDTVINPIKAEQTIKKFSKARTQTVVYNDAIDPGQHVLFGFGSNEQQIDQASQIMYDFLEVQK